MTWANISSNFVNEEVLENHTHRYGRAATAASSAQDLMNGTGEDAPSASEPEYPQSSLQLFRKHWNKQQKHMGNKPEQTTCWGDVRKAFDQLSVERKEYYKVASDKSKQDYRLAQKLKNARHNAKSASSGESAVAIAPCHSHGGDASTAMEGVVLTADTMGDIPQLVADDADALPEKARPIDIGRCMIAKRSFGTSAFPQFGDIVQRNLGVEETYAFSPQLVERVFTERDLIDERFHSYSAAEQEYKQKSEVVSASQPFPTGVSYEHKCGSLCVCYTPPRVLELKKQLLKFIHNEAKLVSPTGKSAQMSAKGWVVAVQQFAKTADDKPANTIFATMTTALGSWHRFPESCSLSELVAVEIGFEAGHSHKY